MTLEGWDLSEKEFRKFYFCGFQDPGTEQESPLLMVRMNKVMTKLKKILDIHCPFPLSSAGHRVCLGEHLARTELFIFFANLLRAFTFRLPEGVTKINTEPIFGATLQPHPYKVCAIPR